MRRYRGRAHEFGFSILHHRRDGCVFEGRVILTIALLIDPKDHVCEWRVQAPEQPDSILDFDMLVHWTQIQHLTLHHAEPKERASSSPWVVQVLSLAAFIKPPLVSRGAHYRNRKVIVHAAQYDHASQSERYFANSIETCLWQEH